MAGACRNVDAAATPRYGQCPSLDAWQTEPLSTLLNLTLVDDVQCVQWWAQALRKVPDVNASWFGDFIRYYDLVDISVAVQTPNGLMVPVVRDADQLGLLEINATVKALAKKVRPRAC